MDLTGFKNYLLINGYSQASVLTHVKKVELFLKSYPELNQENLNSFFASKVNIWSGSSFNFFNNSLKKYAKFLKVELEFPKYHRVDRKVKQYITEKDFYEVISKLPIIFPNFKKVQAILILMFFTGLRPKEVMQLKREDFKFQEKEILIKNTKTFKDRTVALPNCLCEMLPDVFNQEAEKSNAFNLFSQSLTYIFNTINETMGLKIKLSPYSMRRSYCHNLISKGIKLTSLQRSLGHSQITSTLHYLNVSDIDAMEEIRNILNRKRK